MEKIQKYVPFAKQKKESGAIMIKQKYQRIITTKITKNINKKESGASAQKAADLQTL